MGASAATTAAGPLLWGALFQLVGLAGGAALREGAQLWMGPDPRRARFWLSEVIVITVLSGILGYAFAYASDVATVGPPFGAALTTFAVLSGAHAFLNARSLPLARPLVHGAAHALGCTLIGTLAFTAGLLTAGIDAR